MSISFTNSLAQGKMKNSRSNTKEVEVTAHRGASGLAPENTIAAMLKAIELDADYSELDVQESSDGIIVLMHDDRLDRTSNLSGNIWETSYQQLSKGDAGSWFSDSFTNEPIPTLNTVIDTVYSKMKLNIELKINPKEERLVEKVVKLIVEKNFIHQCIVTSFNREAIRKAKSLNNQIKTGYIFGKMPKEDIFSGEFEVLSIHKRLATKELVKKAHLSNKEVHVWTVNEPKEMKKLIDLGVDNIITNYPNVLNKVKQELDKKE